MTEANGVNGAPDVSFDLSNILQALEVIHNPTTKNDLRRQASDYLEQLKFSPDAAQYGFTLARDYSQAPLVRHFGLSLLSHVVRHQGHTLSDQQNEQVRASVLELAQSARAGDPAFIRNKIAELWIELAKRSWALDWFDMDEQLVQLWSQDAVKKDLVLTVLENLSEDIFIRDDTIAVLRGRDLNAALVEVFTSTANYAGGVRGRDVTHHVRYGEEGWLVRITQFLEQYLVGADLDGPSKESALKALATLRSAFSWVMTPAIVHASALSTTCNCLTYGDADITMAAVDALLALYGRGRFEEVEVQALVYPLCQPQSVKTLQQVYAWSVVTIEQVDSAKYAISKKLAEVTSLLADLLTPYPPPASAALELSPFLHFLVAFAEHDSLIVSIPAVHAWVKLLGVSAWRRSAAVASCVGPLLQVVSQRLIQYDQIPEYIAEPAVLFVNEEIELFPERQGFYMNYRRLCAVAIEWICYAHLEQALHFILGQVDQALDEIEASERQFDPAQYERVSMHVLRADAQFSIVDAAFKGIDRWQNSHRDNPGPEQDQFAHRVKDQARIWALDMLTQRSFKDPQIRQRQIKTAVEISNRALAKDTAFAFSVLEHILSSFVLSRPEHVIYSEAVGELHNYATNELRRLALQHADYFVTFYDQLQAKFTDLIDQLGADERIQIDLKSTLFLIVQRASAIDPSQRQARLTQFLEPISSAWSSEDVRATLATFADFARSQAFDQVAPYLQSINAKNIEDWSKVLFDARGAQIQKEMVDGFSKLPLRETRILLSISTEKIPPGSPMHTMICELWAPMIPPILDCILRLTSYNHQLHNPSSWPNVTPNLVPVIQRVLRDRYWQSGISEGSMSDFQAKVKSTKPSLEGFASSVRGRIRINLEQCYSIIHTLGRLGTTFYSLPQVPEMIAEALLNTSGPLSPHHFSVMIQMLPKLIDDCPPAYRQHFLTPIQSSLLVQMDTKLTSEWQKLDQRKQEKHDEESLSDEMRDDSVLRQTTSKAVNLVALWLDPVRESQLNVKKGAVNGHNLAADHREQTMREFVLSNVRVLEPLLVFCTHALAFRDTKSCYVMIVAAQRLVPVFASEQYISDEEAASIREFISTEMLKTAITSLNDGYFADNQQHFAQLIALIWLSYGLPTHVPATEASPAHDRPALTSTPRNILLSLPGINETKIDAAATQLMLEALSGRTKKWRAILLSLLESVRGVRLSELGKIDTRRQQSRILEKYKQRELLDMQGLEDASKANGDDGEGLEGVADMFGSA